MATAETDMVRLSTLDRERFGMEVAKSSRVTAADLPEILRFCRGHKVKMLIARCPAEDLAAVHAMEREGFLLMDTLVCWVYDLLKAPLPENECPIPIRPGTPADAEGVVAVAREAFHGYFGHYHADPRLDQARCDELYTDWASRSCRLPGEGEGVLVAEDAGKIVGFVTMKFNSPEEGEGVLDAVASAYRGQRVHGALNRERLRWFRGRGAHRMVISTQVINVSAQRSWQRLGLKPHSAICTFHKWFD